MPRTPSSTNWCFTLNNPTQKEGDDYEKQFKYTDDNGNRNVRYLLAAVEGRSEGKTPHLQGMIQFYRPKTFNQVKKWLGKRAHFKMMVKTPQCCRDYCLKGDKMSKEDWIKERTKHPDYGQDLMVAFELGKMCTGQGQRSDLQAVVDSILDGEIKVDDIMFDRPEFYHQYRRTLTAVENDFLCKQHRTEMPDCYWLFGRTNVGKSHKAFHFEGEFRPSEVYNCVHDKGWYDGYKQQKVFVVNEFQGEIPISELLQMADKWPYALRRRNRMPMPFMSKVLIITSCKRPEDVYTNALDDSERDQLYRRFKVVEVKDTRA